MAVEKNTREIDDLDASPDITDIEYTVDLGDEEDSDGDSGEDEYYEIGPDNVIRKIEDVIEDLDPPEWGDNLAEHIDENYLNTLGEDLVRLYREDRMSRKEWEDAYKEGLKLLGIKLEKRTVPWDNACGAFHPILAEAVVRYVSEAIMEAFPPTGPANTSIIGKDTPDLLKRAKRVKDELNYQCITKVPEYRPELEMTFFRQAVAGSCFRKVFYDPILRRPTARMVPAEDLVVCYGTSDLLTCKRYTYVESVSENDIRKLMRMKFYRQVELMDPSPESEDIDDEIDSISGVERNYTEDSDRTRLEMYVDLDLPGFEDLDDDGEETGVELPYIVTIDLDTNKILGIRRNHTEKNPYVKASTYFSEYHYIRGFGFYGLGLIHLLGGIADTSTSILRQLVDSGTLSNIPAGYKGKGLRIKNDDTPLMPGELRDVDVLAGTLRDQIVWMPQKEPSGVLLQLLGSLVDEGRRIGSVADMKISDNAQNSPVGTTLALIERVMRVMSAVQARNNVTLGAELNMLSTIIVSNMPPEYDYPIEGEYTRVEDFGPPINIIPVADPSATTISQRLIRQRAAIDLASQQPHLYDMALLHRSTLEVMQIPNASKIVPLKDDFLPVDPVTENMNLIMMRPTKAFMHQDHESHLRVHMAAMQDPLMMQIIGQSPNAQAIQAATMAHIQEHVAYAYRARMEKMAGFAMPDPENPIPAEYEVQMSPLIAAAADKVLQGSQAEAAQQQQQEQAQDPLLQIENKKLQLKEMELQSRQRQAEMKMATDEKKMALTREVEAMNAAIEQQMLELKQLELAAKEGNKAQMNRDNIESRERIEGLRIGVGAAKDKERLEVEREKSRAASKKPVTSTKRRVKRGPNSRTKRNS